MEPVWNDLLTCDYERTRPNATALEWELYTRSLLAWPATLLGICEPYGRLRRPGIVDIDHNIHRRLLCQWHTSLQDADYVADLITRTTQWHRDTDLTLTRAECALDATDPAPARQALCAATAAFLDVMTTHIVNWLLPEQEWNQLLTSRFRDPRRAADCLLALMTPATTGHLLASHLDNAANPRADPACSAADLRHQADSARQSWEAAAVLAAAEDDDAVTQVRLIAALCSWAATSEESRAVLRSRYLTATRRWAELTGRCDATLTTYDFQPESPS